MLLLLLCADDRKTSQGMLDFLIKFYERFPEFQKNKLFLAGQSYAGDLGHHCQSQIKAFVTYLRMHLHLLQILLRPLLLLTLFMHT